MITAVITHFAPDDLQFLEPSAHSDRAYSSALNTYITRVNDLNLNGRIHERRRFMLRVYMSLRDMCRRGLISEV